MNIDFLTDTDYSQTYNKLSESVSCDVLIIGGGIAGLLTAYYLTTLGIKTIVAEKNIIASGTTALLSPQMNIIAYKNMFTLKNKLGLENTLKIYNKYRSAINDIEDICEQTGLDSGFCRKDYLYFSDMPTHHKQIWETFKIKKHNNYKCEFIDNKKGGNFFSFNIESGIYAKNESAVINPVKFTKGLASYITLNGTDVYENTEITDVQNIDAELLAICDGGEIKANFIADCSGEFFGTDETIKKKLIMTYSFETQAEIKGWKNYCNISDAYSPPLNICKINNRVVANVEISKILAFSSFYLDYKERWLSEVLFEMFFGSVKETPTTLFFTSVKSPAMNLPSIKKISSNFYSVISPYENGILNANILARGLINAFSKEFTELY